MPDEEPLLSQNEIDRLLGSNAGPNPLPEEFAEATSPAAEGPLGVDEADALAEVTTVSMGSAATALSSILGHKVTITAPRLSVHSREGFRKSVERPMLAVEVHFEDGLVGQSLFLLGESEAKAVAGIMLGDAADTSSPELNEIELSALAEAMNQMMGSAATAMTEMVRSSVGITPPVVKRKDLKKESLVEVAEPMVVVEFEMSVKDLFETSFFQVMPLTFGQDLASKLLASVEEAASGPQPAQAAGPSKEALAPAKGPVPDRPGAGSASPAARPAAAASVASARSAPPPGNAGERPAFEPTHLPGREGQALGNLRIDLIRDIPVQLSARLGRAHLSVAEILSMGAGSVVELEHMEGEPIELLANGVPVARGEVVVIGGERYGVRITEIVDAAQRVRSVG
ncbi:flagellar motor switch phosphatase FliY [Limnochorda pilosa]|uniref:Flagellar motor switch protein FliN n=1 Tax=Limnochorda pilosa TaxID=1555112 RepID=A0A0K2SNS4_LIMPI|nr:flagellar motor switch phosphatase FliY [Limnochorda pilosa]BAS28788.1 flagellar motor switch protein FliN [Limnochorda pilosa]